MTDVIAAPTGSSFSSSPSSLHHGKKKKQKQKGQVKKKNQKSSYRKARYTRHGEMFRLGILIALPDEDDNGRNGHEGQSDGCRITSDDEDSSGGIGVADDCHGAAAAAAVVTAVVEQVGRRVVATMTGVSFDYRMTCFLAPWRWLLH